MTPDWKYAAERRASPCRRCSPLVHGQMLRSADHCLLQVLRTQYYKEIEQGHVTTQSKFNYGEPVWPAYLSEPLALPSYFDGLS